MTSAGIAMLVLLAVLVVATGLPVWALLIGVASLFAAFGVATGTFDTAVLAAAGPRVVNLLEHDLLQAVPLYVFIGVLLQRLPLADALFASSSRVLRGTGAPASLSALAVGTLIAPMNGSVASSSALLARLVAPRLRELDPARAISLVSIAATIGVVVPPSLVLILLGDAMMRAHTEAGNLPGSAVGAQRIVNTQDVLHAALLPACAVLALWIVLAWWSGRSREPRRDATLDARAAWMAAVTALAILALLGAVFMGWMFAVEAAATGGCLLVAAVLVTRALDWPTWRDVLMDTLQLSGALFALLVGATMFSLVFRLFGTDRWLAQVVLDSPWPPLPTSILVLLAVGACAIVLDAFEMIFVIIPIVAPLLIVRLGDAQQVAVLLLLVLQCSFLLPPLGYAVLMARARSGLPAVPTPALLRSLAPFVAAQLIVSAVVLARPALVHAFDEATPPPSGATPAQSDDELTRQMREMAPADTDAPAPASEPK